jgi:DNA modification methylase
MQINKIHHIDVLSGLKKLEDDSIDCVVTSPPYWALRDYEIKDQIGLELDPKDFIKKLVEVMKECKRVLKPTGTIWLNLGDSYYSYNKSGGRGELFKRYKKVRVLKSNWLQAKQRLLIPFRIAIKCQDELGLILRNDIKWIKQWANLKTKDSAGSSMPTAVTDRLNTCSESLFFFTKDKKYYFNLDNVRIPYRTPKLQYKKVGRINYLGRYSERKRVLRVNPKGKNPGDCIMFPLEPSKERHFAMFPSTLPEFCIKAGCPQKVCKKCGMPYLEIKTGGNPNSFNIRVRDTQKGRNKHLDRKASDKEINNYNEKSYSSKEKIKVVLSCNCNSGFQAGIVLDPFMGSGTTAITAKKLGMNFIGFDLNKKYIKIANRRLAEIGN